MQLDLLSIAAHPDDTELTCSGTVIKMVQAGYQVGLLDLTGGEAGTRGSAALRSKESARAARVMGIRHRENLGLPDAALEHRREYKLKIAAKIRELRPRAVILPYWEGRHPDHYTAGQIGYEACFLAGLSRRPFKGSLFGLTRLSTPLGTCLPSAPLSSWILPASLKGSSKLSFAIPRNSRPAKIPR